MARVHTSCPSQQGTCSSSSVAPEAAAAAAASEKREVFTIWMKSLVLNGSGCTVYNSKGGIVYRVDNYTSHRSGSVYLMELDGKIVLRVLKKKLVFGKWEGYKYSEQKQEPRAWFKVTKSYSCRFFQGNCSSCELRTDSGRAVRYKIVECAEKQACRIFDSSTGLVVAEVRRKLTETGVALGEDVLSLVVEPNVDHSLIMGLVLVYGLMNHSM